MPHLSIYSYHYNYRRLLFHLRPTLTTASAPPPPYTSADHHDQSGNYVSSNNNTFVSNGIMVLSVLLFALICSLGLNSLRRCTLRCSTWMSSDSQGSNPHRSTRLANTGVKKKAFKTFPVVGYSAKLDLPRIDAECVICLSEFFPGDQVRLLPRCHHGFHARCIDKWLSSHSSCPHLPAVPVRDMTEDRWRVQQQHEPHRFGVRSSGDDSSDGHANSSRHPNTRAGGPGTRISLSGSIG